MKRNSIYLFLLSLTTVIIITNNYNLLFKTNLIEYGDNAANALQIIKAKQLKLIYGNYSRFGFYHPGPAFFYVYAIGEKLLFDIFHIVPQPYNAKIIVGLLLQLLFIYISALLLFKSLSLHYPQIFYYILAALFAYFSRITGTFLSIWPPYSIITPFLCYLISCSSFASGNYRSLPLIYFSGMFLFHGHISQIIFIVPLMVISYILYFRFKIISVNRKQYVKDFHKFVKFQFLSLGILFLSFLPIILDILRGSNSNIHAIWDHLIHTPFINNNLSSTLNYFASYFFFMQNQEDILPKCLPGCSAVFLNKWPIILFWINIIVLITIATLYYFKNKDKTFVFLRNLQIIVFLAVGLSIFWGLKQEGGLTGFNGYINFAILALFICIAIGYFSSVLTKINHRIIVYCAFVSVLVLSLSIKSEYVDNIEGYKIYEKSENIIDKERKFNYRNIVIFNDNSWKEAATLVLLLTRNRINVYAYSEDVTEFNYPSYQRIFGPEIFIYDNNSILKEKNITYWKFNRETFQYVVTRKT